MSLPKFNKDIQIISKLADEPNDVGGLSADELKAKFDEASGLIKAFINDTLLPYLEGVSGAGDIGIANIPGLNDAATVQAALQELKTQLNNTSTGSIPDRSLSGEKLVTGAVGTNELANASVTSEKIANASVDDSKISLEKLSGSSIQDKAIENRHFNGKVIKAENVEDNSLTGNQIEDFSIPSVKLANGSVSTGKIADGAVTRAKLANDALYSPYTAISEAKTISSSDIGKTLVANVSTKDYVINFVRDENIPNGAEVAIFRQWAKTINIVFGSNVALAIAGASNYITAPTLTIDKFTMIAFKKLARDSKKDYWLLTGDAEVVS